MLTCPAPLIRATFLTILFLLGGVTAMSMDQRREFFNRSGQEWRLTLVEGTRESVGKLFIIDKFSGKRIGTLDKVGDSVSIPAGAKFLVEFTADNRYFYHDFIIQDAHGFYVEYLVTVPFLSDPDPVFLFKDKHVGPPLDRATDEAIRRAIEEAIDTGNGNLTIFQDFICSGPPSSAKNFL
jgi:hypothetical protein